MRLALAAIAACFAAWLSACGGSSAPPTSPTPSGTRILSISGTTTLNPSATSHLSVTETAGTTTTTPTSVTWQTRDAGIATVTTDGLLTAVSVGQTLVSATADGLFAQSAVTVEATTTGAPGTAVTACGAISTSGAYVLIQDLGGPAPCLSFSNTANVQLNCQGHSVGGLNLTNINGAAIQGCMISDKVAMTNVTSVTMSRSTTQDKVTITQSSSVIVTDSTLNAISVNASSGVQVLRDMIASGGAFYAVFLFGGTNNQVLQSALTGGWTGTGQTGGDDGVLIQNENGDTIQGNTISSFFDMGVEGVDAVSNTTIADNTELNLGFAGIGSGWCTAWTNNVIRNNQISNAQSLGFFNYTLNGVQCGVTTPAPTFSGNQFIGNIFRNSTLPTSAMLRVDMSGSVFGNLVQGNDFGPNNGPYLIPLSGFIDGGGNICGPMNSGVSNFPCTGSTSSTSRRW